MASTCCRYGLNTAQANHLRELEPRRVVVLVIHVGDTTLFPPRADLVTLLSTPRRWRVPWRSSIPHADGKPAVGTTDHADPRRPAPARHATGEAVGGARRTAEDDPPHHRHPAAPGAVSLLPRSPIHPRGRAPIRPSGTTAPTSFCVPTPASLAPDTASCATRDSRPAKPWSSPTAPTRPPRCRLYRISLDRAFNLVSYIDGIWLASAPTLSVLTCPGAAASSLPRSAPWRTAVNLPFCKLLERFHLDHRIQGVLTLLAPPST